MGFAENIKRVKRVCIFCDKRHCCLIDEDKFNKVILEDKDCDEFVLGKCFYCALDQEDFDNLCAGEGDVFYPQGCSNFKPGLYYEEYLANVAEDNAVYELNDKITPFNTDLERRKALKRRKNNKRYHNRMLRKAQENKGFPGPCIDEVSGRVKVYGRGKASRWLKQQAHRRIRRIGIQNEQLYQHGQHKKVFDYWWELF